MGHVGYSRTQGVLRKHGTGSLVHSSSFLLFTIRPCKLSFGVSRTIFEYRSSMAVSSPQAISGRQPVFQERFVSNASAER
jgi:hypothetical protein